MALSGLRRTAFPLSFASAVTSWRSGRASGLNVRHYIAVREPSSPMFNFFILYSNAL
jgi:hypothetical protein